MKCFSEYKVTFPHDQYTNPWIVFYDYFECHYLPVCQWPEEFQFNIGPDFTSRNKRQARIDLWTIVYPWAIVCQVLTYIMAKNRSRWKVSHSIKCIFGLLKPQNFDDWKYSTDGVNTLSLNLTVWDYVNRATWPPSQTMGERCRQTKFFELPCVSMKSSSKFHWTNM